MANIVSNQHVVFFCSLTLSSVPLCWWRHSIEVRQLLVGFTNSPILQPFKLNWCIQCTALCRAEWWLKQLMNSVQQSCIYCVSLQHKEGVSSTVVGSSGQRGSGKLPSAVELQVTAKQVNFQKQNKALRFTGVQVSSIPVKKESIRSESIFLF